MPEQNHFVGRNISSCKNIWRSSLNFTDSIWQETAREGACGKRTELSHKIRSKLAMTEPSRLHNVLIAAVVAASSTPGPPRWERRPILATSGYHARTTSYSTFPYSTFCRPNSPVCSLTSRFIHTSCLVTLLSTTPFITPLSSSRPSFLFPSFHHASFHPCAHVGD